MMWTWLEFGFVDQTRRDLLLTLNFSCFASDFSM